MACRTGEACGFTLTTRPGHPTFVDLPWEQPVEVWDPSDGLARAWDLTSRRAVRRLRRRHVRPEGGAGAASPSRSSASCATSRRGGRRWSMPLGVASGRSDAEGEPLDAVLITRHLAFSLPYRALFARQAVHELRVPCSTPWPSSSSASTSSASSGVTARCRTPSSAATLAPSPPSSSTPRRASTTLPLRRAADPRPAHRRGERRRRAHRPRGPVAARGEEPAGVDEALSVAEDLVRRYEGLWGEVDRERSSASTSSSASPTGSRRPNELGFDVDELELVDSGDQLVLRVQTRVVEPGHHRRRLLSLTGLDAGENQARALLNDILRFRLCLERTVSVPSPRRSGRCGGWSSSSSRPSPACPPSLDRPPGPPGAVPPDPRTPLVAVRARRQEVGPPRPSPTTSPTSCRSCPTIARSSRPADPARPDHPRRVTLLLAGFLSRDLSALRAARRDVVTRRVIDAAARRRCD